jgi:serralysin
MSHLNEIKGTDERDVLRAVSEKREFVYGYGGNDDIYLRSYYPTEDFGYGGDGDDRMYGGEYQDYFEGNAGDDLIDGGDGEHSDIASYVQATGGVVVSLLLEGAAQDTRSDGIDTLFNIEILQGSNFNDILRGDAGNNGLGGGDGDDHLRGGAGDDGLSGGNGIDTIIYRDAEVGVRVDLSITTSKQDTNWGLDHIGSVENVIGSRFNDRLTGDALANDLAGEDGDDRLLGGDGKDALLGGAGADYLNGGLGDDVLDGGSGDDRMTAFIGNDRLLGRDGDDLLNGGSGEDHLDGGAGADRVLGGNGADSLRGGDGDDMLVGGIERDVLTGGAGVDTFIIRNDDTGATEGTADTIRDFDGDGDRVNLRSVDAIAGGEDDKFSFVGAKSFSGAAGELRFEVINGNTFVQGDVDGDKVADLMIRLDGLHDLTATDFVL